MYKIGDSIVTVEEIQLISVNIPIGTEGVISQVFSGTKYKMELKKAISVQDLSQNFRLDYIFVEDKTVKINKGYYRNLKLEEIGI